MTDERTADPTGPTGSAARAALKDALWGMGIPDADAETWIARWEAEAARTGVDPADAAYWDLARAWIDRAAELS